MNPLVPDPSPLYAFADAISRQADILRVRAGHVLAAMSTMRWSSSAATMFRACAEDITRAMLRLAGQLEWVSELLRRHAARVAAFVPASPPVPARPCAVAARVRVPASC